MCVICVWCHSLEVIGAGHLGLHPGRVSEHGHPRPLRTRASHTDQHLVAAQLHLTQLICKLEPAGLIHRSPILAFHLLSRFPILYESAVSNLKYLLSQPRSKQKHSRSTRSMSLAVQDRRHGSAAGPARFAPHVLAGAAQGQLRRAELTRLDYSWLHAFGIRWRW